METEPTLRQQLFAGMNDRCRRNPELKCTPVFGAIENLVRLGQSGERIDIETVRQNLARCALGPKQKGDCGTKKALCQLDMVKDIDSPEEQVSLLTSQLSVEFTAD